MIKRLKRRFMFVNMSILTFVLISILVSIFALMYSSEVKISYEIMESIMSQKNNDHEKKKMDIAYQNDFVLDVSLINNTYDENGNNPYSYEDWLDPDYERPEHFPPYENPDDMYPPPPDENKNNDQFPYENPIYTKPVFPSENEKPVHTTVSDSPSNQEKVTSEPKKQNDNITHQQNINEKTEETIVEETKNNKTTEKNKVTTNKTENSIITTDSETSDNITRPDDKPDEPFDKIPEPDPFKGKVKRSYVYMEFDNIDELEDNIYQFYTSEDDDEIKSAAKQIINDNDEHGKISIGNNKYRYMFRRDPMKGSYSIVMLDRTLEINTINRLLFIFIIIAGAGLLLIFFISFMLANWTIKPVDKAWTQQKEFIANASHELKTPLTVISTNTDVVLSNPEEKVESQTKWLNYIKNETVRMSKLVNNLLCIAKYDANRIETVYGKVDLSDLVSGVCLQYEPLIFENKKTIITDIDKNLQVLGDEDKLKQVVNILIDNALKYSTENGTIKISLKKIKQSSVCMTVSNSSEEISKDKLDKIFDRFYRVESSRSRKTGGSGLGLNIAKTIIENHKGTINVINKDNITSFIVTF